MEFGELLKALREEAGLSQNALARAAGIDPTHLNRIERSAQGLPRRATILKLIRGLGLSPSHESAQKLLDAGRMKLLGKVPRPATLGSPISVSELKQYKRNAAPVVRELKKRLLRALDIVVELEESIGRAGED